MKEKHPSAQHLWELLKTIPGDHLIKQIIENIIKIILTLLLALKEELKWEIIVVIIIGYGYIIYEMIRQETVFYLNIANKVIFYNI